MIAWKGICISFVEGEVIQFSVMNEWQKTACQVALEALHGCGVKHGDVHYKNFLLNGGFAYIIDFGFSVLCSDQAEFKKERELLAWKLTNNDNSIYQEMKM
jgi:tRNA A-37 threonylcarbamoyl transferase component Bud32